MFSDHDETSPSIATVSSPSVACSMLAVQQQKRLCRQFVDVTSDVGIFYASRALRPMVAPLNHSEWHRATAQHGLDSGVWTGCCCWLMDPRCVARLQHWRPSCFFRTCASVCMKCWTTADIFTVRQTRLLAPPSASLSSPF